MPGSPSQEAHQIWGAASQLCPSPCCPGLYMDSPPAHIHLGWSRAQEWKVLRGALVPHSLCGPLEALHPSGPQGEKRCG